MQQAWREKMTLCFLILILCGLVGFATVGRLEALCPLTDGGNRHSARVGSKLGTSNVLGQLYNVSTQSSAVNFVILAKQPPGRDIIDFIESTASDLPACSGLPYRVVQDDPCPNSSPCILPNPSQSTIQSLGFIDSFDWEQFSNDKDYFVLDGAVLNMTVYMLQNLNPIPSDNVDTALRTILKVEGEAKGDDHDGPGGKFHGEAIPMWRWED
ncbi:hypothetical protein PQX77_018369 [Marasmius sp. AFHP31]|nr:hypothetical protein PQX77_018369 [Marasmius sp. AFHP31]